MTKTAQAAGESQQSRILSLEAGRGIAASLVILYHVSRHIDAAYKTPQLREFFQFGHAGVDFFFGISGFIILYVHYDDIGRPHRLRRYVGRRFSRLMPTYWVAFSIAIVMTALGHHALPSLGQLGWQALLLPSSHPMVLGVAWTLRFEVLFYVLFSILIANRNVGLAFLSAWFGFAVGWAVMGARIDWLPEQFHSAYAIEFFFGMVVAYCSKQYRPRRAGALLSLGLFLLGSAALLEDLHVLDGYAAPARLAYGIPSAITIMGIVGLSRLGRLSVPQFLRVLGAASYSLYLFQFIFIGTAWQVLLKSHLSYIFPPIIQFAILVLAAIIGGVVVSKTVEQPLIHAFRSRFSHAPVRVVG